MKRLCLAVLAFVICAAALSRDACARAFEVRLLKGDEKNGAWGTDEFSVNVNALGLVRHVAVGGKELVWQAAALYTSPVPSGETEGVRTVQGEDLGGRGLTCAPPTFETRDERGARVFLFRHRVANKKVLGGAPLCDVRQRLVITPTGEITVVYECEWLEAVSWHGFGLLIFFSKETSQGRPFTAFVEERVFTGHLVPGGELAQKRLREPLTRLTLWSEVGPFHYVLDAPVNCEFSWHGQPQLQIKPKAAPYRGVIFKGTKDRIEYRILLPVLQQ